MPADISRRTHERRNGYSGAVAQQGRVILDRDFNALEEMLGGELYVDALDIIGPCGTPDNGFEITLPQASPPEPPFWSPPSPLGFTEMSQFDFLISAGTMYLGGRRVEFPPEQHGETITYSYFDQPDWPVPDQPATAAGSPPVTSQELAYLDVWEQEVSAVEDFDLLEPSLGGPDTTERVRLLRRVEREATDATSCAEAWSQLVAEWQAEGLSFDPNTMGLAPDAGLLVTFMEDAAAADPCDPVAMGGYLGVNNQAIRVMICATGASPTLLWGWDNASFTYRVEALAYEAQAVQLTQDPPDQFHFPQTGQAIEVLRTAAVLGAELDDTNPDAPTTVLRCVAAATGKVETLLAPYGPHTSGDPNLLYFGITLPQEYLNDTNPLFARVWQAQQAFTPGTPCELIDPVTGASTGVCVTIAPQLGSILPVGAFWTVALRPGTPQAAYPEELLVAPQPPDGPNRWVCPLAVIEWSANPPTVIDCREQFDNLVTLTKRPIPRPPQPAGCCTVHVTPEDLQTISLQEIVDKAVSESPGATVCFAAGEYPLRQPLRLGRQHSHLTLECCGGLAEFHAKGESLKSFGNGVIVADAIDSLTIRGLTIDCPPAAGPLYWKRRVSSMIGIRATNVNRLTIDRCAFAFDLVAETDHAFGAGVFLQGFAFGIAVTNCSFTSKTQPTCTSALNSDALLAYIETLQKAKKNSDPNADFFGRLQLSETVFRDARVVATVGILAAQVRGTPDEIVLLPCTLDDATFRDNEFVALTAAVVGGDVRLGSIVLERNTATLGIGGFWLSLLGWLLPGLSKDQDTQCLQALFGTLEWLFLMTYAEMYPPTFHAENTTHANGARILVTGNNIETIPNNGLGASAALVFANVLVPQEQADLVSTIAMGNRIATRSAEFMPAIVLMLPDEERCTLTTNVVSNAGATTPQVAPSLWIMPNTPSQLVKLLSVVGNTLYGETNLSRLKRADTIRPTTWLAYNSIIS